MQARLAGVPQEADGIDLAALDDVHARLVREGRRVRLLYVVPNFQNPTGLLIGREKRLALLEWAARRDILIVEDDPYRELYFDDSAIEADVRPMKADDAEGRIVYLSSFSKTLAPGYRVAWIDAPPPIAAKLEDRETGRGPVHRHTRSAGRLRGRTPRAFSSGSCRCCARITARSATSWSRRCGASSETRCAGPIRAAGFSCGPRCRKRSMPIACSTGRSRHGVVYVAGEAFFVERDGGDPDVATDSGGRHMIRLAFSAASHERIREGVARLAAAIDEELEEVSRSGPVAQQAR